LARLLVSSPAGQALGLADAATFSSRVACARSELPALNEWNADGHEMQAAWRILDAARERPPVVTAAMEEAVRVLLALIARGAEGDPYEGCTFDVGYFDRYPINLRSVMARAASSWAPMTLERVVHTFTTWTIETHFRVAMQKLAASPARDTFKVKPFDGELRVVDAPGPSFTIPRIQRAISMLQDLDLVVNDDAGNPHLTSLGEAILGEIRG
jgi:hypothetical protein